MSSTIDQRPLYLYEEAEGVEGAQGAEEDIVRWLEHHWVEAIRLYGASEQNVGVDVVEWILDTPIDCYDY